MLKKVFLSWLWFFKNLLGLFPKYPVITIYEPVRGWAAVKYGWFTHKDPDGMEYSGPEPDGTGFGSYATAKEARREAAMWAFCEDCRYDPMFENWRTKCYRLSIWLTSRLIISAGNLRDKGHGENEYMKRRVMEDVSRTITKLVTKKSS